MLFGAQVYTRVTHCEALSYMNTEDDFEAKGQIQELLTHLALRGLLALVQDIYQ
jgi:hypothetical protein